MRLRTSIAYALRAVFVMALVVTAAGLILFGPRSAGAKPRGRVVVTYWEKWVGFEGDAARAIVNRFNETAGKAHGVYVDYVPTTGVDLKTMIAVTGGDPPDLAGLWQKDLPSFASGGGLEPLDDRARAAGIEPEMFIPVFEKACRYHGELYALPLTPASIALYYNKTILAQHAEELTTAGLDPAAPPRTIAQLDAYADVLTRRDDSGRIEMMAYLPASPDTFGWFWDTWPLWFGGKLYNPALGEFRVDTPAFLAAYEWVGAYARRFGVRDVTEFESGLGNFNSPDNPFMSGRLAMVRQGPWFANTIRAFAPQLDYGVAPFPTIDGREAAYCDQDIIVIPRGAGHADEAWRFIEWLYKEPPISMHSPPGVEPRRGYEYYVEQAATGPAQRPMPPLRPIEWLCWMHCKNSPLAEQSDAFLTTHPNPAIALHDRLARSPDATTAPPLSNWPELQGEFAAAYRDIWLTGAPASERLHQCQARIDDLTRLAKLRLERYGVKYP